MTLSQLPVTSLITLIAWSCTFHRMCTTDIVIQYPALALQGPGLVSQYSDSQRAERSGDRFPVGARFSAPVQTGPWAHPASYTMGTGSFPGGKTAGAWRWSPTPSSAKVKERVELYLYWPSGPSWPVLGWTLPLPSFYVPVGFLTQLVEIKKKA